MGVDPTSLAAYATGLKQAQLGEQVAMRVAKKGLDAAKQQGEAAMALLQAAADVAQQLEPGKGNHLNVKG
jgi:hypothetical protein